jgi:Glutathione-dependent formaldehyde-activating enzyme.
MLITGSCHCRNVTFSLAWLPDPAQIPARACTCTFCVKHGGVWTSCPTGRLRVWIRDRSRVHGYAFGTRTAVFHVCAACGVVPVVTSEIEGRLYAVVSVNAFDGIDASMLVRSTARFDGERTDDRLARRKRNWIADVAFLDGEQVA